MASPLLPTLTVLPTGRSKRGLLDMLPSLPLDILCEIFGFLDPSDLLVLARTSKAFRHFLLKHPSIWSSARRNIIGLPEPPSDMSEAHYASLVFGYGCHYKGCDGKARDIVWHLRIRSCASCRPKHQPINANEDDDSKAVCEILDCCTDALERYIPCGPFLNAKGKSIKGFQRTDIKALKDDLCALSPSEHQAYLDRRREATELLTQFANTGIAWQLDVKKTRIAELRNKRAARAEIIRDCLVETGFREEIDYFGWDRIRKHPLINITQPLTDKARSSVLDQVQEYMLGWRELRMEEGVYGSRRQLFADAWLKFTTTNFRNAPSDSPYFPLPPSATIGFSESIDSIIRQPCLTSDQSLLGQLHAAFFPACEYILDWHKTIRRELASLLPDYRAEDDDEAVHARLKLATSIFQCNAGLNCRGKGRTLAYPEILFHPCFTLVRPGDGPSPKDPRGIAKQKAGFMMGGNPWSCSGRVQVHPRQYVVEKTLLCCGKDPRSTTAAEMDEQDPRLVCQDCAARDRVMISMSWRRAIQHDTIFHPDSTLNHPWIMVCCTVRARLDAMESRNSRPFPSVLGDTSRDYSICLHCPPRIPSWNTRFGFGDLIDHIKKKHGIPSPALDSDYAFDRNITPVYLDPVTIKC